MREAPAGQAIAVRVLWGAEILRVAHLSPPRTFQVPEAASRPILVASWGRVSVVVPRGAAVRVLRGGVEERPEGGRIALAAGMRVILVLPPPHAGSAYRTLPDAAAGASITIDLAVVPRERLARRPFAGLGRLMASCALAAAAAAAALLTASPARPREADAAPSDEEVRTMRIALEAARERSGEDAPPCDVAFSYGDVCFGDRRTARLVALDEGFRSPVWWWPCWSDASAESDEDGDVIGACPVGEPSRARPGGHVRLCGIGAPPIDEEALRYRLRRRASTRLGEGLRRLELRIE